MREGVHVGPDGEGEPAAGTKNPERLCEELSGSPRWCRVRLETTTPKEPSSKGNKCASATRNPTPGLRRRASLTIASEKSTLMALPALDRRCGRQAGSATNVEDAITLRDLGRVE
jgi:hypothetical protein